MSLYVATGSYVGDGADNRNITVSPSFAIKFVYLKKDEAEATNTGAAYGSISGMGDGAFVGDENNTNFTDVIQSMGTGTFQIGTNTRSNETGVTFYYLCIGGDDTEVKVGTYTGNATDNRAITGVGFAPEVVIIKGSDNGYANLRFGTAGDSSQFFGGVNNLANYIQSLDADGFTVGTGNSINNSGVTYYYVAIKSVSGQTDVGSYTGNATDDRSITGVGFQPDLVWVKADSGTYQLEWTDTAHSADSTSYTERNVANFSNGIQALQSDGFQIGSSVRVNNNTTPYYFYAIKNAVTGPNNLKTLDTNVKANIKTYNTNPLANIKSINTNA